MNKKILFSSLAAAALMVGCTNDNFTDMSQNSGVVLDRPVVDFSFGVNNGAMTRMIGTETGIGFDVNDKVGGVLLDYDKTDSKDWYTIAESGHVGNNKFTYNASNGKFETAGTTVVGSWLFYMQYDPWMTTHRDGVELDFPEVQNEAVGYSEIVKHNFMISPVVNLDGGEENYFDYNLPMSSVFSYAVIKMKFPEAVDVQKIVVKPTGKDLQTSNPLSSRYKISNKKVPVADVTAKYLAEHETTANAELKKAGQNLTNSVPYNYEALNGTGAGKFYDVLEAISAGQLREDKTVKSLDIIALDCLEEETISDKFEAFMAIPAGEYQNLSVYAYTDKGVYKYNVQNDDIAAKTATATQEVPVKQAPFYLLRNTRAFLHKISAQWTSEQTGGETPSGELNMTEVKENSDLESTNETNGTVVISQKDLIAVIKGITTDNEVKIRVLGDKVEINQDVMDALEAKLEEKPNAYLSFAQGDGAIAIVGNSSAAEPLKLHDIKFNGGARLKSGYAEVEEDLNIPTGQGSATFTVAGGANLKIVNAENVYAGVKTEANGTLVFENDQTNPKPATINVSAIREGNLGNIIVNTPVNITVTLANNCDEKTKAEGVITNNSILTIKTSSGAGNDGTIVNNGELNLEKEFSNTGAIANGDAEHKATINVEATVKNSGTITNAGGSTILAGGAVGKLENSGEITNFGDMYCYQGKNKINNTGKINAKNGSTTYITTNSASDEFTSVTNDLDMGEIVCESRNVDVSVTETNQQGYISWNVPTDIEVLKEEKGDKFNKVYLNGNCDLTENHNVGYVVVNGKATVELGRNYFEFTFNAETEIYAEPTEKIKIAKITVAENVRVKVPTENEIGVYTVSGIENECKTEAEIINKGTILVGGNLWSSLEETITNNNGIFASGDGQTTAFHWGQDESTWKNE